MKSTTGRTFDPTEPFRYFLAGTPSRHYEVYEHESVAAEGGENRYPHVLIAVNEVETDSDHRMMNVLAEEGRSILLDSGVFNLATAHARAHGMSMDDALRLPPEEIDGFDELLDRYYSVAQKYEEHLWGIIEVDQGGPLVKPITRARIERESGIIPMPVWHALIDGGAYYDELVAEYDRICVGTLVQAPPPTRWRIMAALYDRALANGRDTWHHLLGVTTSDMMFSHPIHGSSDSSSWLAGPRWAPNWHSGGMGRQITRLGVPEWSYDPSIPSLLMRPYRVGVNEAWSLADSVRDFRETHPLDLIEGATS
jgi:hypothetical protein